MLHQVLFKLFLFLGVKLQVVKPSNITWHSGVISWKAPHVAFKSYRLTYQREEDIKVMTVVSY